MRYTLRQLQVFLATCHQTNISKAAQELAMSQSAASAALKDLETQFDIQLFDRVGKRLHLNDTGRHVQTRAESLLAIAQELEDDLAQRGRTKDKSPRFSGLLKVGATLTVGNYLAVGLIEQFLKEQPSTRVTLEVANTSDILEQLIQFKLDIGFIEGEYHHPELDIRPWMQDTMQCFCSPKHTLALRQTLTDADLKTANWILREPGSGTRQTFDRAMAGLLPDINIVLELQHTEAIKRAVISGLGISCLSEMTIRDEVQQGLLTPLHLPHRSLERYFYIVLHRHKYLSANLQHWINMCETTSN